jgi:hypothetical protein
MLIEALEKFAVSCDSPRDLNPRLALRASLISEIVEHEYSCCTSTKDRDSVTRARCQTQHCRYKTKPRLPQSCIHTSKNLP